MELSTVLAVIYFDVFKLFYVIFRTGSPFLLFKIQQKPTSDHLEELLSHITS